MTAACVGMLPAFLWIAYASTYLLSSRAASWIRTPDFALLEDTLARFLGPWPFPKLAVLALLLWVLRRWGFQQLVDFASPRLGAFGLQLADVSALLPSALMVLGVLALVGKADGVQSVLRGGAARCNALACGARGFAAPQSGEQETRVVGGGSSPCVCGGSNPFLV